MVSSDFRKEAREKLSGKWGKVVCIVLAYAAILILFNIIERLFPESMMSFVSLVLAIIQIPLSFGLVMSLVKLFNNEEVKAFDFLSLGFNNFGKSWGIIWNTFLKMLLPVALMIVSLIIISLSLIGSVNSLIGYEISMSTMSMALLFIGSVLLIVAVIWSTTKSYYYQITYVIAAEKPELSSEEVVQESEKLMSGKRGKLFALQLSFIGWAILSAFTMGIGYLWLIPYVEFAEIAFYKFLCEKDVENKDVDSSTIEDENN